MSMPLCGLRGWPLKKRRLPNESERGPARRPHAQGAGGRRAEAGDHALLVRAFTLVARQVGGRQIDRARRHLQVLLGIALGGDGVGQAALAGVGDDAACAVPGPAVSGMPTSAVQTIASPSTSSGASSAQARGRSGAGPRSTRATPPGTAAARGQSLPSAPAWPRTGRPSASAPPAASARKATRRLL
jgi:hypothetical protein